jgi:anti-sigma regulatory factor (Ser/Thr protein kinase)
VTEQLRLPSTPDAPPGAVAFVESLCERYSIGPDLASRIALAAAEAAANAAEHGNAFAADREVLLSARWEGDVFELAVEDEGAGLADHALETAALPEDPMDTGGRGLFLIQALADEAHVEAEGRRVVMRWTCA